MQHFPGEWIGWDSIEVVSQRPYKALRRYRDVHHHKYGEKIPLENILPPVVRETNGKDMNFNCFAAVMNFYFPGFGLKPLNPEIGGFFSHLIRTTFRDLDHQAGETLRPGDLIIIRLGSTMDHAMVYLGNNVVWQKPSLDIPAGFYNFSDTVVALTQGTNSKVFKVEYFRFDVGSPTDHYSGKIYKALREGNTDPFFMDQGF